MVDEVRLYRAVLDAVYRRKDEVLDGQSEEISFNVYSLSQLLDDDIRRHEEEVGRTLHKMVEDGIFTVSGSPTTYTATEKFIKEYEKLHNKGDLI